MKLSLNHILCFSSAKEFLLGGQVTNNNWQFKHPRSNLIERKNPNKKIMNGQIIGMIHFLLLVQNICWVAGTQQLLAWSALVFHIIYKNCL